MTEREAKHQLKRDGGLRLAGTRHHCFLPRRTTTNSPFEKPR